MNPEIAAIRERHTRTPHHKFDLVGYCFECSEPEREHYEPWPCDVELLCRHIEALEARVEALEREKVERFASTATAIQRAVQNKYPDARHDIGLLAMAALTTSEEV